MSKWHGCWNRMLEMGWGKNKNINLLKSCLWTAFGIRWFNTEGDSQVNLCGIFDYHMVSVWYKNSTNFSGYFLQHYKRKGRTLCQFLIIIAQKKWVNLNFVLRMVKICFYYDQIFQPYSCSLLIYTKLFSVYIQA